MAYQGIGTGITPNDNNGDSLLTGAVKINSNFEEIYNALGDGSTINFNQNTTITAGNGLTGGGDLSEDRTLNVGAGDGISVAEDSVAVDDTVVRTSGNQTISNNLNVSGTITNGGFDFILGNSDQSSRGNTGLSRALVKDTGSTLVVNYGNDFGGGIKMVGQVTGSVFAAARFVNGSRFKSKNIASHTYTSEGGAIILTLNYAHPAIGTNNLVHSAMARDSTDAGAYIVGPGAREGANTASSSAYGAYAVLENNTIGSVNMNSLTRVSIIIHEIDDNENQ